MRVFDKNLEKSVTTFSGLELKQLLVQLIKLPGICFRFRLLGEMWIRHLTQVTAVHEKSALFYDEVQSKYYLVKINNIMQFEIDGRFQNFQPFFHYDVIPSVELE
jgi:hypothetical protein